MSNVLVILSLWLATPPTTPAPLVATITASSELKPYKQWTFGVAQLADGRLDTSWQPDAQGAYGLGQWVRLDFGKPFEVTRIEVDNGFQTSHEGVDFFCANARVGSFDVLTDGGETLSLDAFGQRRGELKLDKPVVTRTLTFVVRSVYSGKKWPRDLAVSEIRAYGREAKGPVPIESGPVQCESARLGQLRWALVQHCAAKYRKGRPSAECTWAAQYMVACDEADEITAEYKHDALPISEADWKRGVVSVGMHQATWDIPFVLEFERKGGTWAVVEASCRDGKDACGATHTLYPDAGDPEIVKGACN